MPRKGNLPDIWVFTVVVGAIWFLNRRKKNRLIIKRGPPLRQRNEFWVMASSYTEAEFEGMFRMSVASLSTLTELMRSKLERSQEMGIRGSQGALSPAVRLGMTLRLLSGSTYMDVAWVFQVGRSTVYSVFHSTIDVINDVLRMDENAMIDGLTLQKRAVGFKTSRTSDSPFDGCVGALDGIAVPIEKPKDVSNPAAFFNRKGFYAPAETLYLNRRQSHPNCTAGSS